MIGRLGHRSFLVLVPMSLAVVLAIVLANAPSAIVGIIAILNLPWLIVLYVGRLHDAGYSGLWWPLAMFTSLLGFLALAAAPADKQANKYGSAPSGIFGNLFEKLRSKSNSVN